MSDEFEEPLRVYRWACDEIEKFREAASAFVGDNHPEPFTEEDAATGQVVCGYILPKEVPDDLSRLAYYSVTNLRNALDQAVHAASLALGTSKPHKTNFPVADSANEFVGRLTGHPSHKGIPNELHDKLISFNAFWPTAEEPQGDLLLRALLDAANPNKHRAPIKVTFSPGSVGIKTMIGIDVFQVKRITDHKFELFRTTAGKAFDFDADIEQMVAFSGGRGLDGQVAGRVFKEMGMRVGEVIDEIRAETERLLATKRKDVAHG